MSVGHFMSLDGIDEAFDTLHARSELLGEIVGYDIHLYDVSKYIDGCYPDCCHFLLISPKRESSGYLCTGDCSCYRDKTFLKVVDVGFKLYNSAIERNPNTIIDLTFMEVGKKFKYPDITSFSEVKKWRDKQ